MTGLSPLRQVSYGQFSAPAHLPLRRNGGGSSRWPLVVGAVSTALTGGFWLTLFHFAL